MKLKDLKIGEKAVIEKIERGNRMLTDRLLSMGLLKGTELEIVRKAPLGDPLDIKVRGFDLSLRKAEAEVITVGRK